MENFMTAGIEGRADQQQILGAVVDAVANERRLLTEQASYTTYRHEYAKKREAYQRVGISEEEYIASRRVDDGFEQLQPATANQ